MIVKFSFVKQPWEERTRAVDFSGAAEIQAGESIATGTVTVSLDGITQPTMLVSLAVNSPRILFRVREGEDGKDYDIAVRAITNAGHRLEADITMYVRD